MSLFDGKGLNPRPTNRREMINQMSDSVRTNFLDPMMGSLGMESEETTIMNIMKDANLSDPKSVTDTFSKIMAINPEAAAEFKTQVIPLLEAQQAAVPAANRIKEGTSRKVGAGDNTLKTQTYTNGAWVDAVDAEGKIYTEKQYKENAPSTFEEKKTYIEGLTGKIDPTTGEAYTQSTLDGMVALLLTPGGVNIDFGAQDSFEAELGKLLAVEQNNEVKISEMSRDALIKTNGVLTQLNQLDADGNRIVNTGFFSSMKQGFDKVFAAFGDENAMKAATGTEMLEALLGSDVFPLIKSLGIGARGLDTPAEREFLQKVMTGTIKMEGDALEQLTRLRQKYSVRAIKLYNSRLKDAGVDGKTYYSRYEKAQGRKLQEIEVPKLVRPNKREYQVTNNNGDTVTEVFPRVRPLLNESGEASGELIYQYRPNGPFYSERGEDISNEFQNENVTFYGGA